MEQKKIDRINELAKLAKERELTDEEKVRLTKLDVHSLAVNRVNVSLRNFQTFFDAFGIKEGDPMWRPESERVHIW